MPNDGDADFNGPSKKRKAASVADGDVDFSRLSPSKLQKPVLPRRLGRGSFARVFAVRVSCDLDDEVALRISNEVTGQEADFAATRCLGLRDAISRCEGLRSVYGPLVVVTVSELRTTFSPFFVGQVLQARRMAAQDAVDEAQDDVFATKRALASGKKASSVVLRARAKGASSRMREATVRLKECTEQCEHGIECGEELICVSVLAGPNLFQRRPTTFARMAGLRRLLLRAMAFHIKNGLWYYDLKPANICECRSGQTVVPALLDPDGKCSAPALFQLVDVDCAVAFSDSSEHQPCGGNNAWYGNTAVSVTSRMQHPVLSELANNDPASMIYLMLCSAVLTFMGKDDTIGVDTIEGIARHYRAGFPYARSLLAPTQPDAKGLIALPLRMLLAGLNATPEEVEELAPEPAECPVIAEQYAFWNHICEERYLVLLSQIRLHIKQAQCVYYDAHAGPDEDYLPAFPLSDRARWTRDGAHEAAMAKVDQGVRHGCFSGADGVVVKELVRACKYSQVIRVLDDTARPFEEVARAGRDRVARALLDLA